MERDMLAIILKFTILTVLAPRLLSGGVRYIYALYQGNLFNIGKRSHTCVTA